MRYKKKPKVLYFVNIVMYILVFFAMMYLLINFQVIEKEVIDPKTIRLLRDITNIALYPQYLLVVIMIIRTLGFDIKKFDFKSDIDEMKIDITDNEEVELNIGVDVEKIKTRGRRQLREFKYYVLENKIFVFTIVGVIGVISIVTLILGIKVNKVYSENEEINTNYYTFNISNSYITKKDDLGTNLGYNNSSYVIIKINIKALINDGYKYKLNPNNFLLMAGNNTYKPVTKYYDYFKLIGTGYKNQVIQYNEISSYIFVYNVSDNDVNKVKYIRYEGSENNALQVKKIKLDSKNLDSSLDAKNYNLNEMISFNNSIINGTFKVLSYEINKTFTYKYNSCFNNVCNELENTIVSSSNSQILKIDVENTINRINNFDLANNYMFVKYKIDNNEYTSQIINKTPTSAKTTMYINVDEKITEADNIWLEINIRNEKYKYMLK